MTRGLNHQFRCGVSAQGEAKLTCFREASNQTAVFWEKHTGLPVENTTGGFW